MILWSSPGYNQLRMGSSALPAFMGLGAVIAAIFSGIFLFYANSFLIKRRKKELGLYAVLGMEKRHIKRILFFECLYSMLITLICGILLAVLLGKLLFLGTLAVLQVDTPLTYSLHIAPFAYTPALFALIFLILHIYNGFHVQLSNPITLLKGESPGEREPKSRRFLGVAGIVLLGCAYGMALSVSDPVEYISTFFFAVILVIIATYALFTASSISFLKALKRNKRLYYKPGNFISISGMLYRMKQNAAGLAGICILSTMVIVTIGTTATMYIGQEATLRKDYPNEFTIHASFLMGEQTNDPEIKESIEAISDAYNQEITSLYIYTSISADAYRSDDRIESFLAFFTASAGNEIFQRSQRIFFMPLSDYLQATGGSETLSGNEILYFQSTDFPIKDNTLYIGDVAFHVKQELATFPFLNKGATSSASYIILNSLDMAKELVSILSPREEFFYDRSYAWNTEGDASRKLSYGDEIDRLATSNNGYWHVGIHEARRNVTGITGSFFLLGIFLGLLFLVATTLIIYFKQVSEGHQDRKRYVIMQKVGMSKAEVSKNVRMQIFSVFMLPLVMAVIHTTAALPVIKLILHRTGLSDGSLITTSMYLTTLIFAIIYTAVYFATAKVYNRMVQM